MYQFIWDEIKRKKNLNKHGLDFGDAEKVFHDDYALSAPDNRYSDDRWLLLGRLHDQIVLIAYAQPGPDIYRIISMRKAERHEIKRYRLEQIRHTPSPNDPLIKLLDKLKQNGHTKETL